MYAIILGHAYIKPLDLVTYYSLFTCNMNNDDVMQLQFDIMSSTHELCTHAWRATLIDSTVL